VRDDDGESVGLSADTGSVYHRKAGRRSYIWAIEKGANWYNFQQQLGSNPFGPAQFFFDLAMPPIDRVQLPTIETKVTAFDLWRVFAQYTNPDGSTNTWVDYTKSLREFI